MKNKTIKFIAIISAMLLLSACGYQAAYDTVTAEYYAHYLVTENLPDDTEYAEFEAEPNQSTEADNIFSLFQSVLRSERLFTIHEAGSVKVTYLDEFRYTPRELTYLAVFDMDGDGIPEVIIQYRGITLIFIL